MKNIITWIETNKMKIFLIFLFCQPFLDVVTSCSKQFLAWAITPGIVIRMIFLGILFLFFLYQQKKKSDKKSFFYLVMIIIYMILEIVGILTIKGINPFLYELQNMARTFYFPIFFVMSNFVLKEEQQEFQSKEVLLFLSFYLFFILVPTITHTSFDAYTQGKVGSVGWFSSTNEISAILCILMPFVFDYLFHQKEAIWKKGIFAVCYLATLFLLGTKTTIIILGLLSMIEIFSFLNRWKKEKKYQRIFGCILCGIISIIGMIIILPKTNFYKNIVIHLEFLEIDSIQDFITNPETLDHFIFSQRLTFLENTNRNYQNASFPEKILGIGYVENYSTDEVSMKTIEMDPFDIFYRQGPIGFLLFFLPFVLFVINQKERIKNWTWPVKLSLLIAILMACMTGHVITAPSVSIVIAMLLLMNHKKESVEI